MTKTPLFRVKRWWVSGDVMVDRGIVGIGNVSVGSDSVGSIGVDSVVVSSIAVGSVDAGSSGVPVSGLGSVTGAVPTLLTEPPFPRGQILDHNFTGTALTPSFRVEGDAAGCRSASDEIPTDSYWKIIPTDLAPYVDIVGISRL